jgi:hypothetical protein
MRNIYLISIVLLCTSIASKAQYIQNGSSVSQTTKNPSKNGDISVGFMGISSDGYCKYPQSISVSYTGSINGKNVNVEYVLSTDDNFQTNRNRDSLYAAKKILVKGTIKQNIDGKDETTATFSEIVYNSYPQIFTGWLVSLDSKLGNSNTSSISKTGLICSSDDIKFTGKTVAFFRIQKDFSLSYVSKPVSLDPKPNNSTIKK